MHAMSFMSGELDLSGFMNEDQQYSSFTLTEFDNIACICEEIEALHSDYSQMVNNLPCEQRCVQLLVLEKASVNSNYFTTLAEHAFTTCDNKLRNLLTAEGCFDGKSVENIAAIFRLWFQLIVQRRALQPEEIERAVLQASGSSSVARDHSDTDSDNENKSEKSPLKRPFQVIDFVPPKEVTAVVSPTQSGLMNPSLQRRKSGRACGRSTKTITKGVYATQHGFRVQLNMRPVLHSLSALHRSGCGNIKFSRNCRQRLHALWLYEVVVLISDRPNSVEDLVARGNYVELQELCWPGAGSEHGLWEYHRALGAAITTLRDVGLLSPEEVNEAASAFAGIRAPAPASTPAANVVEAADLGSGPEA
jgi:hypothetical protein